MCAITKRVIVTLIIGLCAISLALHFVAESLGGIQDHFIGGGTQGKFDSHEGDQFIISELRKDNPSRTWIILRFPSILEIVSRSPAPLLQPPKPA
jgi:hypothetical protein